MDLADLVRRTERGGTVEFENLHPRTCEGCYREVCRTAGERSWFLQCESGSTWCPHCHDSALSMGRIACRCETPQEVDRTDKDC